MPFGTYSELQSEIARWLGERTDLLPQIPAFISLAEEALRGDLRCREQHERAVALLTEEFEWLPDDFVKVDTMRFGTGDGKYRRLTYRTMAQLDALGPAAAADTPVHFSIIGSQIRFWPPPTAFVVPPGVDPDLEPEKCRNFEIVYWSKVPTLTTTVDTTIVLQRYPSLYLFGSLVQAEPYILNDPRVQLWAAQYDVALRRANGMDAVETQATLAITAPMEDVP